MVGANGFVGRQLSVALVEARYDVIALSRRAPGNCLIQEVARLRRASRRMVGRGGAPSRRRGASSSSTAASDRRMGDERSGLVALVLT